MSNLLEKLNNLKSLQNENNLLNEKINKLKLEHTHLDDKKKSTLIQRKDKIQEDLTKYSINSCNNNNSNNNTSNSNNNTLINDNNIQTIIPKLLMGNTIKGIETIEIDNLSKSDNMELIPLILKGKDVCPVSNTDINIGIDNCVNNIEINDELIIRLFESSNIHEFNNNLKNLK